MARGSSLTVPARLAVTTRADRLSALRRTEFLATDRGRFDGRVAVVTGGSRGIGAAVCERLLAEGGRVHCVYGSDDDAAERFRDSVERLGARLVIAKLDVTSATAVDDFFGAVAKDEGSLDLLVNCVGAPSDGLVLRARPKQFLDTLELNLGSAVYACKAALPAMLKGHYGRIVNVGSVVASLGNPGQALYSAAKAGLEGFTRSLAREVGSRGITVNCVAPGFVDTDMTAGISAEIKDRAVAATAVGRTGHPDDIAHAVAFLCDERTGYVTGAVLHVNGGMYM